MSGIKKFQLEEKIRLLYYRHRGNILAVANELNIDLEYIKKVTDKISKRRRREVDDIIAYCITDMLLLGREQRLFYLQQRLDELLQHKVLLSACCSFDVKENPNYTEDSNLDALPFVCKKCQKECETIFIDKVDDNAVAKLIDRMRKEDEQMGKFLLAQGIISKEGGNLLPGQLSGNQYNIVDQRKVLNVIGSDEQDLAKLLEKIEPRKLTSLRKKVEAIIKKEVEQDEKKETSN